MSDEPLSYKEAESLATRLVSESRAVLRFVREPRFREAWKLATDAQKREVIDTIERSASGGVARWIQRVNAAILARMPLRELRHLGKAYGIPYYNRKTRLELIKRIQIARHNVESKERKGHYRNDDPEALDGLQIQSEESGGESDSDPLGPGSALFRDAGSRNGQRGFARSAAAH